MNFMHFFLEKLSLMVAGMKGELKTLPPQKSRFIFILERVELCCILIWLKTAKLSLVVSEIGCLKNFMIYEIRAWLNLLSFFFMWISTFLLAKVAQTSYRLAIYSYLSLLCFAQYLFKQEISFKPMDSTNLYFSLANCLKYIYCRCNLASRVACSVATPLWDPKTSYLLWGWREFIATFGLIYY